MTITTQELKKVFDREMKGLLEAIDAFAWENKEAYALWLAQSYYLVRHTTRFACYTASRIGFEHEDHHKHLLKHLREEVGHEMLAFTDLKKLGFDVKNMPETMSAKLMLQTQYYWIGVSPYAHYGFIWVLESLAVMRGPQIIKRVKSAYKEKCDSFLVVHAEVDGDHATQIFDAIKTFDAADLPRVKETVEQTCFLYARMLNEIEALNFKLKVAA